MNWKENETHYRIMNNELSTTLSSLSNLQIDIPNIRMWVTKILNISEDLVPKLKQTTEQKWEYNMSVIHKQSLSWYYYIHVFVITTNGQ